LAENETETNAYKQGVDLPAIFEKMDLKVENMDLKFISY